jgi:hypothetical protein
MEMGTIKRWLQAIVEATKIVEIDIPLADGSARAFRRLLQKARKERLEKPGLGDAIVLATAKMNGASILTGGSHFRGLTETLWIGESSPYQAIN